MSNGFLLGKFLPPHVGHQYLIDFARNHCDKLVILVGTQSSELIPGNLRYRWIRESFPDCIVVHVDDDSLPQEPPEDPEGASEFRQTWVSQGLKAMDGMKCDFVYASETYGEWMAEGMGAEFVPVDIGRVAIPTSGTKVRQNLFHNFKNLMPCVREDLVRRIVVFGPESTGKTTIAKKLASSYDEVYVPEYGREFTEFYGSELTADDFRRIQRGHEASVKALKKRSKGFMIEDTDPVMTRVWFEMLTGSGWYEYNNPIKPADFYLLMDVDVPWIDDGTRYFSAQEDRNRFFDLCKKVLDQKRCEYKVISGDWDVRYKRAWKATDDWLMDNVYTTTKDSTRFLRDPYLHS